MISPNIWQPSTPVPVLPRPPKPERVITSSPDLDRLRSALAAIPNDGEGLDYDAWRNCVFAVHHATEGSDDGLALVHEFSARSGKYDPDFLDDRVWPYVGVGSADPITEKTLFALAGRSGWQDPATADEFDVLTDAAIPASNPDRFKFVQAAEFSAGAPPGWIIKHVLPRATLVVLYGESGSGKSFLALDLLGAVAHLDAWQGHKVTPGLACGYIAAEGAAGFRNRLTAYAQHHKVPLDSLPIAIMASAPNFTKKDDVVALGKAMQAYGHLDVLVVDTLAQVTPGANENSGEDMGVVIENCNTLHKVTGATILLVHHSGKDASRGARGWSGIKGALDAELEVVRAEHDRVVTITKMKDGPGEGKQYGFKLLDVPLGMDEDGEVYGSCVVEYGAVLVTRHGPKGANQKVALRVFNDLIEIGSEDDRVERGLLIQGLIDNLEPPSEGKKDRRREMAVKAIESLIETGFLTVEGTWLVRGVIT